MQQRGEFSIKTSSISLVFLRSGHQLNTWVSFGIALTLLAVQSFFCLQTNSLLLFCAALIQLSLLFFLFPVSFWKKGPTALEIRLGSTFLNGFVILLLSVHLFLECFNRLSAPSPAFNSYAWLAALLSLGGNWLIYKILSRTKFMNLRFGTFRPPMTAMIAGLSVILIAQLIIQFTDISIIDHMLSLPLGALIFVWAAFIMVDAYWHITDFFHSQ